METGVETVKIRDGLAELMDRLLCLPLELKRNKVKRSAILLQSLFADKATKGV
jgi:hypothetical protein